MDTPQTPANQTPANRTPDVGERRFTPVALFCCALALLSVVVIFGAANKAAGLLVLVAAVAVWFLARDSRLPLVPPAPAPIEVAAPSGQSSLTLTSPGPRPDDVVFVWRQFRSLDPSEHRTPEEFRAQLGLDVPMVLATDVTHRWATDFAEAMRRAGAEVRVD